MHLVWINSATLSFMLRRVSFSVSADTRFAAALSSSAGLMASNFSKKKKEEKKKESEKNELPKKAEADDGQISLGDLSSFGEAA